MLLLLVLNLLLSRRMFIVLGLLVLLGLLLFYVLLPSIPVTGLVYPLTDFYSNIPGRDDFIPPTGFFFVHPPHWFAV